MAYTPEYLDETAAAAAESAERVIPAVLDLFPARSVIDVGCGLGQWASVFIEQGVEDVLGVDGPWVDVERLLLPPTQFIAHDLTEPLQLDRRFDLAICLEVAEHLPETAAATLLDSLANAADVVLFSAAIPGQGGVNHVNEQWPAYWQRGFATRGYDPIDVLRDRFWNEKAVRWWYAHSMVLYRRPGVIPGPPPIEGELRSLIHPIHYADVLARLPPPMPRRIFASLRRRLHLPSRDIPC